MRTAVIDEALEASISRERLGRYLAASEGRLDLALSLYEHNSRISEAFYSPLQSLEICFRNRLCAQLVARYGPDWPTNGRPPLAADAKTAIEAILSGFQGATPRLGDIVARLHFGFWVGLLGKRYDQTLWREALHKAFRAGASVRRVAVHSRFNALRRFRNRIAHHEPIFDRDVFCIHAEIIEAIGWMCPDTAAWTLHLSHVHEASRGEKDSKVPLRGFP